MCIGSSKFKTKSGVCTIIFLSQTSRASHKPKSCIIEIIGSSSSKQRLNYHHHNQRRKYRSADKVIEFLKKSKSDKMSTSSTPTILQSTFLGGTAAVFAVNFTHPIELVKSRVQINNLGVIQTISETLKHEGLPAFWKVRYWIVCWYLGQAKQFLIPSNIVSAISNICNQTRFDSVQGLPWAYCREGRWETVTPLEWNHCFLFFTPLIGISTHNFDRPPIDH